MTFDADTFCGRISEGRNLHIPLVDDLSGHKWLGKFCCPVNGVRDVVSREVIGARFARKAGLCVPNVEKSSPDTISNRAKLREKLRQYCEKYACSLVKISWEELSGEQSNWYDEIRNLDDAFSSSPVWQSLALVEWFEGATQLRNCCNFEPKSAVLPISLAMVFNVWCGNHDSNIELNILVRPDGSLVFVDYGFAGPGIKGDLDQNVNHQKFPDFGENQLCSVLPTGRFGPELVDWKIGVDEIEKLDDCEIHALASSPSLLYPNGSKQMNEAFANELCRRRGELRVLFQTWDSHRGSKGQ